MWDSNTMIEHAATLYKSDVDGNIPPVSPFYGKANDRTIGTIVSLLGLSIFDDSSITPEALRTKMKTEKKAVISSKKTGETFVDLDKRNCNRLTFGNSTMESIKDQLMKILRDNSLKLPVDINDVELEMSHGDVLNYDEGGFFDYHRDGDIRPTLKEKASSDQIDQYSMILCLDSGNKDHFDSLSGCTSVYLPSKNLLIFDKELDGLKTNKKRLYMDHHTYPQTRMKNYFVVFPSNALHASHSIDKGDYKLALKFDLFIKRPKLTIEHAKILIKRNYYCSCLNCSAHLYTSETQHLIVPSNPKDMIERGLLDLCSRTTMCECQEICCGSCCICTCAKCIDKTQTLEICKCNSGVYLNFGSLCGYDKETYDEQRDQWYEDYSDEDYSDDDFCNGYDQNDY